MRNIHSIGTIGLIALLFGLPSGQAAEPRRAYIDGDQRVHVVGTDGRDVVVSGRRGIDLIVAPDRNAVAWLAVTSRGQTRSADLRVYRGGHTARIACGREIADFAFMDGGRRLVVQCPSPDGAQRHALYDTATLAVVDEFSTNHLPARPRPDWLLGAR